MKVPRRIRVADLEYEVQIVRKGARRPKGMGEFDEGLTDFRRGKIYVRDWGRNQSRVVGTLVHELVHACLDASGADQFLDGFAESNNRLPADVEEDFVRMISPALVIALRSSGLLKE